MQAILRYDWPGNVRELRTAIEHGVVMTRSGRIVLRDLPAFVREAPAAASGIGAEKYIPLQGSRFNLHDPEHRLILQALEDTGGNVTHAAKKLGISRRTLHRKIKELKTTENGDRN
jgi:transcriptional regulator of acetoin/glycerol metabolism